MAVNPPLTSSGVPVSVVGETYLLERDNVELRIKGIGGDITKGKAKGKLYLTTKRICFVNKRPEKLKMITNAGGWFAFDIPLMLMRRTSFNQPIFGCNNLSGEVDPLPGRGHGRTLVFKIRFVTGGAQTFLNFFLALQAAYRPRNEMAQRAQLAAVASMRSNHAFIDRGDPSRVFVAAPGGSPPPPGALRPPTVATGAGAGAGAAGPRRVPGVAGLSSWGIKSAGGGAAAPVPVPVAVPVARPIYPAPVVGIYSPPVGGSYAPPPGGGGTGAGYM